MIDLITFNTMRRFGITVNLCSLLLQVTTRKENHYAAGPPFDAVSSVGRLQVVGKI